MKREGIIRKRAAITPGITPAAKRAGTEVLAITPYMMKAMLGGITIASDPELAISAAAYPLS